MNAYTRARQNLLNAIKREHPDHNHKPMAEAHTRFLIGTLELLNKNRTRPIYRREIQETLKLLK